MDDTPSSRVKPRLKKEDCSWLAELAERRTPHFPYLARVALEEPLEINSKNGDRAEYLASRWLLEICEIAFENSSIKFNAIVRTTEPPTDAM
jgi:hypothetical protein